MDTVYQVAAIVGGTILVLQTVLSMFGWGDTDFDTDFETEFDADVSQGFDPDQTHTFFRFLGLRTLVAFVTFFGLTGLACQDGGLAPTSTLLISTAAGSSALFIVYNLILWIGRLQSDGNVRLSNALGKVAKVYLRIPAEGSGQGKVTVPLQGRSFECTAITAGEEIATGSEVQIVEVLGPRSVKVLPVEEE